MLRPWEIYSLSDPRTGEIRYIGITFRGRQRYNEHLSRAATGGRTHRDCWVRSLASEGLRPAYSVLEVGNGEGWQERERSWIAKHREDGRLTNRTDGGEGLPGYVPSPELRRKWSKARRGVPYRPWRKPPMLGRRQSPEAREKIRQAGTGRTHSEATRARLSARRKGRPLPTWQREMLAASHRGKPLTEAHRQKIAATTTNRKPVRCVESGQIFPSITAASRALGVTEASVSQAIRKGCRCKGNHLQLQ
jgi:hypothetical protein